MNESLLDGKRVLIVDDEPDVLATLEDLLSMCDPSFSFELQPLISKVITSVHIILFGLEERVLHHQAGPQANPRSLQDHDASGDLTKTEVTCRKTVPNEVQYLQQWIFSHAQFRLYVRGHGVSP